MTHDELMSALNMGITMTGKRLATHEEDAFLYRKTLRAVVELHKPKNCILKEGEVTEQWCTGDTETLTKYPCPTIQAIEKELT